MVIFTFSFLHWSYWHYFRHDYCLLHAFAFFISSSSLFITFISSPFSLLSFSSSFSSASAPRYVYAICAMPPAALRSAYACCLRVTIIEMRCWCCAMLRAARRHATFDDYVIFGSSALRAMPRAPRRALPLRLICQDARACRCWCHADAMIRVMISLIFHFIIADMLMPLMLMLPLLMPLMPPCHAWCYATDVRWCRWCLIDWCWLAIIDRILLLVDVITIFSAIRLLPHW